MIALDTNVLLRYFARDDLQQTSAATHFLESELSASDPGYVSIVVLAEVAWVLRSRYRVSASEVNAIVRVLLDSDTLVVENPDLVEFALSRARGDLADALIHELGRRAGCERTVTFDRDFARSEGVDILGD